MDKKDYTKREDYTPDGALAVQAIANLHFGGDIDAAWESILNTAREIVHKPPIQSGKESKVVLFASKH